MITGAHISTVVSASDSCHLFPAGCGYPAPDAQIFEFPSIFEFTVAGVTVHFTKPMLLLVLVSALIVIFFIAAFRNAKIVPRGIQNVAEMGYLFVRDGIARDTIGREGDAFVPFLFTFFFLVWGLNFMGILPFAQIPVTSRFAIPVAFAAIVYFTWVPLGIKRQGFVPFFKGMIVPKDVPAAMLVLLIPLEILSNFIVRPFTHAVRLFANMFAGHLLIVTFAVGAWYLFSPSVIGVVGSAASFGVTVGLTGFEILIQALQAYVFTLLAAVYINDALHAH